MQKLLLCFTLLSVFGFWCHAQTSLPVAPETKPALTTAPTPSSNYAKCEAATFPQPSCCGAQIGEKEKGLRARIYGGRETQINEHPWLVYIDIRKILVNGIPDFCAGSLINTRWVLSAANCFINPKIHLPENIPMRFGEWNLDTEKDCDYGDHCAPEVVIVNIDKVFAHHRYVPNSNFYNIALLRLSNPVNYSDFIQPICLPWDGLLNHNDLIGKFAEVAGWGRTETNEKGSPIKMMTRVKVHELMNCKTANYPESYSWNKPTEYQSNNSLICAGGEHGVDSCLGDSGGPLMMKLDTSQDGHPPNDRSPFYLIGVVSYNEDCGIAGNPGVYTGISTLLNWIRKTVRSNS